jgi:hypothetical protein
MSTSVSGPLFVPGVFAKVLAATTALAVVGLAIALATSGFVALRDVIGTLLSAGIVAYMVHLLIVRRKEG